MARILVIGLVVLLGPLAYADGSLLAKQQEELARIARWRDSRRLRNTGAGVALGGLAITTVGVLLVTMFGQKTVSPAVGLGAGIPSLVIGGSCLIGGVNAWTEGQRRMDLAP